MLPLHRMSLAVLLTFALASCSANNDTARAHPDGGISDTLVVGNKGEDSISFVDLHTGRELKRADTGPRPHEVAISPDGSQIAVAAYGGSSIDVFDVIKRERAETIDLSPNSRPHGLLWIDDDRIVATAEGSKTLVILDRRPGGVSGWDITSIPTGQAGSHMVAVSPDKSRAYVANLGSGSVTMIDLLRGKKIRDAAAGKGTEGIAVTRDGKEVWASARETHKVYVYDATTLHKKIEIDVGKFPLRVIPSPDGKYMVTSNLQDGSLSVIDVATRQVVRTIPVLGGRGEQQVTIMFSPDGTRIYAALTAINKIAEIDFASGKRLGMVSAGAQGDGLAIIPAMKP